MQRNLQSDDECVGGSLEKWDPKVEMIEVVKDEEEVERGTVGLGVDYRFG